MSWQFEANLELSYYVTSGTQFRSPVLSMFHKTGYRSGFENFLQIFICHVLLKQATPDEGALV